jgi:hypothetical protein
MITTMTQMDLAELATLLALWTDRTADARTRGDRDLIKGCTRNLRAVQREIARRHN